MEPSHCNKKYIVGIILAAGFSKRFGSEKLSAKINGQSILKHICDQVNDAKIDEFFIIAGKNYHRIINEIPTYSDKIKIVPNNTPLLSSSVRFALSIIPENTDAVMLILGDMPLITTELMNKIVEKYRQSDKKIIFPCTGDTIGNPRLFDKKYFNELKNVQGDKGGREVTKQHREDAAGVEIDTKELFMDIDTKEDFEKISHLMKKTLVQKVKDSIRDKER